LCEDRVKRVLSHYESQSEEEAVAEDEAAWEDSSQTFIEIPDDLIPAIREMLAKRSSKPSKEGERKASGAQHRGEQPLYTITFSFQGLPHLNLFARSVPVF
jgi:hypothetical protein